MGITVDSDNRKTVGVASFFVLCLWELVPTIMVLWCFRSIPPTNDSICWCFQDRNYEQDYESLPNKDYNIRPSFSYDSTQVLSPGKWSNSPPHLDKSFQSN